MYGGLTLSLGVVVATLALAAWSDLRRLTIPNLLTYPAAAAGLTLATTSSALASMAPHLRWQWLSPIGLVDALLGVSAALGIMLPLFAKTRRGGGDLKLAGALGSLLGPTAIVNVLIWTFISAGIYAAITLAVATSLRYAKPVLAAGAGDGTQTAELALPSSPWQRPIPLAGFFAVGVALALGGF